MSESQNPGFLGDLKDKAQELAANISSKVEAAADKLLGEEKVDQIKDVLNTDVKDIAQDAQANIKEKAADLLEGAENLADRVLGEERVEQVKSFLHQDRQEGEQEEKEEEALSPESEA